MFKLHFWTFGISFEWFRLGWSGKKDLGGLVRHADRPMPDIPSWALSTSFCQGPRSDRSGNGTVFSPGLHPFLPRWRARRSTWLQCYMYGLWFFLTVCMICKITYQQLKGDDFYSSGDAWGFIRQNWGGVVWGPVATLALLIFFCRRWHRDRVAGRDDSVGRRGSIRNFLHSDLFCCAGCYFLYRLRLSFSITMSPAVVGTVGEDALEVAIQSFSLAWSQPWRLVLYMLWMKISVFTGSVLLGTFMASAMGLVSWACGLFMKEKLANMVYVAGRYVPFDFTRCDWLSLDITAFLPPAGAPSGSELLAGGILGVMLILLTVIFSSYVLSAYASGISLIYVILRKRKDDENLLEWEDDGAEEDEDQPAGEEVSDNGGEETGEDTSVVSENGDGEASDTEAEQD